LGRQLTGPLAAVLEDVRDRVTGGAALGDALAVHDDWFDPLFISAARVGELSGHLDDALGQLAEHLRASETLRNKVTTALTYPLILVVIGTGVVLFLMQFVVPQLLTVLIDSGRPLPASTRLLKGVSDGLINHWLILAVSAVLLGAGAKAMLRHPVVRRFWHRTQLRLPIVGRLIRANLVAGFAQRMSLLLSTGIPFVEAARHVAALSRQTVLADELTALAIAVESGSDIAPALGQSRVFPPVVLRLLAVGQDSGELPFMLKQLKERYEAEVQLALARFTAALEPVLIVALASIVGFVVFACLMPILEVTRGITVS
jgi:type II secretory pathway component PulF